MGDGTTTVEWDKLPFSCREGATIWLTEYGKHVDPDALKDVTIAVAVGLMIANMGGHKAGLAAGRAEERKQSAVANTLMEVVSEWIHANKPLNGDSLYQMDHIQSELPDLAERCCDVLGYFMADDTGEADHG